MADLEAAGQHLSFDDILEAVQESKRGRWFLSQYADRLRQQEAATLLDAINRLESRMTQLAPQAAASPSAITAVQSALHKARQDLVKLGLAPQALSEEGRLFARIAENARKSMPIAVDSNAQIVRALELVSEIDHVISTPPTARGADYFDADASLFERPATSKPVLVAKTDAPPEEAKAQPPAAVEAPVDISKPAQGAKLVIRRSSAPATELASEPTPTPVPAITATEAAVPAMEPVAAPAPIAHGTQHVDTPRIVIIRRKAEDMPEMNLPEQDQSVPEQHVPAAPAIAEEAHSAA